ncbi:MAG: hypothetical protein LIO94_13555 [Clostridiales bacterium]|nr:hypothetical protein [Clostridiales bacterium]
MDYRDGLGESYRKGEVDGKKKEKSGSRAYQKFFEDYEEVLVPKKNGKGSRISRIYRGQYYRQEFSDACWYGMKVAYPLLAVVSCLLFCSAALPAIGANHVWYVNLLQALSIGSYLWLFVVLCHYVAAPRSMTISGWKRACRPIKNALRLLIVSILLTAVSTVLYYLINQIEYSGTVLNCLVRYLLGAGFCAVIFYIESRTTYSTVPA